MYESIYHVDTQARRKLRADQLRPWANKDHVMEGINKDGKNKDNNLQ